MLATLTGATAGALGATALTPQPAAAAGTDRGMTLTVVASDAGAPWAGNGDRSCGGTADEVEINAAISDVNAACGGTVELSRGTFVIGAPIEMRGSVTLVGHGAAGGLANTPGTTIRRSANVPMMNMVGTPGSHIGLVRIRDIEFDGADLSAIGIAAHYASTTVIERIGFRTIYSCAIEGVEFWDSTIRNCRFDYCGSRDGSNRPAVGLYQNRPGVPSTDGCNSIYFTDCTWETIADQAIGFYGTNTGAGSIFNCHLINCRVDTGTVRGQMVRLDFAAFCTIRNFVASIGAFENQSAPQDTVAITNSYGLVIDGFVGNAAPVNQQTVRTFLSFQNGNTTNFLRNLFFVVQNPNRPSVAAIEFSGTNEYLDLGYHRYFYDPAGNSVLRTGTTTKKYRNSGTATVANGQTNVTVVHGLGKQPAIADITLSPQNSLGAATKFWFSNVTATQFQINVNANPGATTAKFSWQAEAY